GVTVITQKNNEIWVLKGKAAYSSTIFRDEPGNQRARRGHGRGVADHATGSYAHGSCRRGPHTSHDGNDNIDGLNAMLAGQIKCSACLLTKSTITPHREPSGRTPAKMDVLYVG